MSRGLLAFGERRNQTEADVVLFFDQIDVVRDAVYPCALEDFRLREDGYKEAKGGEGQPREHEDAFHGLRRIIAAEVGTRGISPSAAAP